jgi:exodeoxyribonuclease-1
LASQLTGDGTGALTYQQALAETDKLLKGSTDADDLLSQYRGYLAERVERVTAFLARQVA